MQTHPYKGSSKGFQWSRGQTKGLRRWFRTQANREVRRNSKDALRRYQDHPDSKDYNDFLHGGESWD